MNNTGSQTEPSGKLTRRSVIAWGGSTISASLMPGPASAAASPQAGIVCNVKNFGASGNREDNATKPFRDAIGACAANGGGVVFVPAGDYTVGTVRLLDHITLNLDAGATLFLSQNREDFIRGGRSMIFAEDAKNIAVTGRGTLNGLARYEFREMSGMDPRISKEIELARVAGVDMRRYYRSRDAMNTYMFMLNECENFLLEGVSIINSPLWNVRLSDCNRVSVRGVYIYSDLEKGVNADGIDICSSSNVTISDSVIVSADDSICVKSVSRNDKKANPSRNIVVTNCVLSSSSTPMKIGTETVEAEISNVLFHNCVIRNSNKGFGIDVLDGAAVSDIMFRNITIETNRRHWNWWGNAEMCKIVLAKRSDESKLGSIRNVVIDNIVAHQRGTSIIVGHTDRPLENVTLSNVRIVMNPEDYADKRATDALRIEGVKGLKIRDLGIIWAGETEAKWQSALVLCNVSDFEIDTFEGRQGLKDSSVPAILLDDVSDGILRNSHAPAHTGTFIHIAGEATKDIVLSNVESQYAKKGVTYETPGLQKVVSIKE